MMLKWVKTYCPQVTFVLKTDDDMFINVRTLTEYLSQSDVQVRKDLIVGSLFCRVSPIKDAGSKWYEKSMGIVEREHFCVTDSVLYSLGTLLSLCTMPKCILIT